MKKILATFLIGLISGCATTAGYDAQTSSSKFDGVKSVAIQAHGAACKGLICPMIGATWLEDQPNNVGFTIQLFNEIANINSIAFNIDGEIIKANALGSTDFDRVTGVNVSRTSIVTNYSVLTKILSSKRTWIRVSTSKGLQEVAIIDGQTDSKAYHALKRFDAQVKQAKAPKEL